MSILQDIYNSGYEPARPSSPEYQAMLEKGYTYWDKVQEVLGEEFLDRFLNHQMELEDAARCHDFREGFRLGVSLMLEIL